jgi:hypothetical protein
MVAVVTPPLKMPAAARPMLIQTMDKGWVSFLASAILIEADSDEREAVVLTPFNRFTLQGFGLGLCDFSATPWKPFSSKERVVLASSKRLASWSSRTRPQPMQVVLKLSHILWAN